MLNVDLILRERASVGFPSHAARLGSMRIGRVASPDGVAFVSIEGESGDGFAREIAEHPFGAPTFTGRQWPLADVRVLAPILASKVVCVGKNYAAHITEMGGENFEEPVIFLKPNTAIIGPNAPIVLPAVVNPVHHEGELAAVIGRPCKDVPAARAAENILGYTIANDVTARDEQRRDGQWTRAKGHDTFCPVGPWIATDVDPSDLDLRTEVNGELRQHSRTSLMIHDVGEIVEFISAVMTLLPGDLILTGTPEGVGPIDLGDTVSVTIEGIGTLTNPVVRKGRS
jgi:2-keto-4-pentenoate hydratase/2-oxohepta-3-ene-1,7-dioic acid hydratase in catechol pathway